MLAVPCFSQRGHTVSMRKEPLFREEYDFLKEFLPEALWETESD